VSVCAGVDGCKGGWIAVWRSPDSDPEVAVFEKFHEILERLPASAFVTVDMPIGLPEQGTKGGRAAEQEARRLLRKRKSSVFSIPSRTAVYAEIGPFPKGTYLEAHARAVKKARDTSVSSSGFPIQAFGIFPKIREIDVLLRENASCKERIFESHPEIAFRALNTGDEMNHKKSAAEGEEERRQVLAKHGLSASFLQRRDFYKAKADDFLDACSMLLIAERLRAGTAVPYPSPPHRDALGLPIAIWA
jgi:predicted RNase H-like nuclease